MKHYYTPVFLFIFFFTLLTSARGQHQTMIGLDAIGEWTDATLHPGIGAVVERKITRRSGFETGLFYKSDHLNAIITVTTATQTYSAPLRVTEHYLSIPLLYKYYSRIINVSAGPSFDYYTGFTQKDKTATITVNSYSVNPKLSIGLLFKASKPFNINKQILLEPELRLNPNFSSGSTFAGLGIAAKYKLD